MNEIYVCSNLAEPFKAAEEYMRKVQGIEDKKPEKKKEKEEKIIPMPPKNEKGGDKDKSKDKDKNKKKKAKKTKVEKKKAEKKEIDKRQIEIEMIQLVARRDYIRAQLNGLNPGKRKDARKIAAINIALREIDRELERLQTESGININELDNGTRVGRFIQKVKNKGRKIVNKVKKFCKRNQEFIIEFLGITIPVAVISIFKKIFGKFMS